MYNVPFDPSFMTPVVEEPLLCMIARAREILERHVKYRTASVAKYLQLIESKRMYLTTEQQELERLWDTIREDAELTDYVITFTREFMLRCSGIPAANDNAAEFLALQLSNSINQFFGTSSVIDTDTLEMIKPGCAIAIFQENPWYSVMHLVAIAGIEQYVANPVTQPEEPATPP